MVEPWLHPNFLRDGKYRVRERYHRGLVRTIVGGCATAAVGAGQQHDRNDNNKPQQQQQQEQQQPGDPRISIVILPDALTWRKYLRLIQKILQPNTSSGATAEPSNVRWYLLESVAEYMDHRNQSPCLVIPATGSSSSSSSGTSNDFFGSPPHIGGRDDITLSVRRRSEASAPQERTTLQRMAHANRIQLLCDLSLRDMDHTDDFDSLNYIGMTMEQRTSQALMRAVDLILQQLKAPLCYFWVLVSSDQQQASGGTHHHRGHLHQLLSPEYAGVPLVCSIEDAVSSLIEMGHLPGQSMDSLLETKLLCDQEYVRRNSLWTATADATLAGPDDYSFGLLSEASIEEGLTSGRFVRGRLVVTKENPQEAFVSLGSGLKLYIDGSVGYFGHAFHHDIVIIEPLPVSKWRRPVGKRRIVFHRTEGGDDDENENLDNDHIDIPPVPTGRVVAVDKPSRREFVATLLDPPFNDDSTSAVLVVPMDPRIPKIRLRRYNRNILGMRLTVEIDGWDPGSHYPHGHCQEILGPIGSIETEIAALLIENEVRLDPFSAMALASLPPQGDQWHVTDQEVAGRLDLRTSRRIFSVDPPGCQDIDDSMHVQILPSGDIEVGVHIADVTHFVTHNSALDREAQVRGTTFYLVDRRFDMLPSLLSSNLCSLHQGVDRLAVSAIWTMSSDYTKLKNTWFGRTVIHNCAAMTYDQADRIVNGQPPDRPNDPAPPSLTAGKPVYPGLIPALRHDLTALTQVARQLKKVREKEGGAVDLSSGDLGTELKFVLDSNGNPTKVASKDEKEIHNTIAELMIQANTLVAERIYKCFPESALLRIHRSVEEERFEDLSEFLKYSGVSLNVSSNMSLANSLKQVQENQNVGSVVNALFRSLATRAMTEAQYVCTGDGGIGEDFSHYGLGVQTYTHFTSPIRRYADVIVHKQLLASLEERRYSKQSTPTVRTNLLSLPESDFVSVLSGEGLGAIRSDVVDTLATSMDHFVLDTAATPNRVDSPPSTATMVDSRLYTTADVTRICEGLNLHNRLAKQSSADCQNMFLSLYFKEHIEEAQAVVLNVRDNGFWVYVPKFDLRGPVFVRDTEGSIQIDPAIVGLGPSTGLPATLAFAESTRSRRFPSGRCVLDDDSLRVEIPGASRAFAARPLDVVTVELTCRQWDVRARVPPPRFHLIAKIIQATKSSSQETVRVTSSILTYPPKLTSIEQKTVSRAEDRSIADVLSSIKILPALTGVPLRNATSAATVRVSIDRHEQMRGRAVFANFVNPDTKSAKQGAAQESAAEEAALRRAQLVVTASRNREYDTARSIERSVTLRQQRLAAEKTADEA